MGISELSKRRKGARITELVKVSEDIRPDNQPKSVQLADSFHFAPFAATGT